jgi:hypothetical protein
VNILDRNDAKHTDARDKLRKMDPRNADLLAQKQKYLYEVIDAIKRKLVEEKTVLEQLKTLLSD